MSETAYTGPTPAEKLREINSKRFINFYSRESFTEANFGQIKEKLDSIVLRPIEIISSIVNEKGNISTSDIDSISFKPLRDLAILINSKKQVEKQNETQNDVQLLSSKLEEQEASKEKINSILQSLLDTLLNQCQNSPNAKVQGLSGAIKSADISQQPKLLEMIISTLNSDIQQRMSANNDQSKNSKDQEKLIAQLKNSNEQLQTEIANVKKRYEAKLSEAKDDYERQLQMITFKNEQVEDFNSLHEELEAAKNEMISQITQQNNEKAAKMNATENDNNDNSASKEMSEKLDTMMSKVDESKRKNELFEECLRELQNTLSLIDGEGINASTDFAERTKSIQRRLMNIEKASLINESDIQKKLAEINDESSNSDDKVKFYKEKLKEMVEISEKCIRQKDRAEEKAAKLQQQVESLTSQKEKVLEMINQVEKTVLEIESMLNITSSDKETDLTQRMAKIKDEVGTHINKND